MLATGLAYRLVEESDFEMAKDMLGEAAKEVNLDDMIPKSEVDFITYGKLVAKKICNFESSIHYSLLLKVSTVGLQLDKGFRSQDGVGGRLY